MKKIVSVILIMSLAALAAFALAGCQQKAEAETEETEAAEAGETKKGVTMPNPMVGVEDDEAFEKELGIKLDTDKLPVEPSEMYIIGENLADVRFTLPNVENEDIEYCLRATKEADKAETMHGVYDSDMEEVNTIETEVDGETTSVKELYANTESTYIYMWQWGEVYFSLTYKGTVSQMQLAEILDSCMAATVQ